MKLPIFSSKPVPRIHEMSVADCYEAFMHASASFKKADDEDRRIIGCYIDGVLDAYNELQ
jgi:hypothetical protein